MLEQSLVNKDPQYLRILRSKAPHNKSFILANWAQSFIEIGYVVPALYADVVLPSVRYADKEVSSGQIIDLHPILLLRYRSPG